MSSRTQDTDGDRDHAVSATDPDHHGHKRRRKKRSKRHKHTVEEKEKKIEGGSFHTNNNNIPGDKLQLDNEVTNRNSFTTWPTLYYLIYLVRVPATLRVDI